MALPEDLALNQPEVRVSTAVHAREPGMIFRRGGRGRRNEERREKRGEERGAVMYVDLTFCEEEREETSEGEEERRGEEGSEVERRWGEVRGERRAMYVASRPPGGARTVAVRSSV